MLSRATRHLLGEGSALRLTSSRLIHKDTALETPLSYYRDQSTMTQTAQPKFPEHITSVWPTTHCATKVVFENRTAAEFKHIWLRDNCKCSKCMDPSTKQKLLDTTALDLNVKPKQMSVDDSGCLNVVWEGADEHQSKYEPAWLFKYGQSFINKTFEADSTDREVHPARAMPLLWDKEHISANKPEVSYEEFMGSEEGLLKWLDCFHKYGLAFLRGVPINEGEIEKVVNRFAYVKETQYGRTFDVVNVPTAGTHLAYSGVGLQYHTDMNYREKSPGMQMLHCIRANNLSNKSDSEIGGKSMFVDGFLTARWLEDNEPTTYHILTHTDVRFSIKNEGRRYSATWPIITTNSEGEVVEIHYNNRTMQPLQAPTEVVSPFYHAYKVFSERLDHPSAGLVFNLVPGDLVAFNNRRVLHGRSAYDATSVDRFLQGCYVDIDEAGAKYDQLLQRRSEE